MSIIRCDRCAYPIDTDFTQPYEVDGKQLCESCMIELEEQEAEE